MNNIYANSVGNIIKKDIYIIKNDLNDKVYIGQSINSEERFKSHCKRHYENSIIDASIQKYGKEHFWYEILESQIDNYNERERYWIKFYDSLTPNGYNIRPGGEDPPMYYGENNPASKLTDKDVEKIKNDLKYTKKSLDNIASEYKVSKKQILRINQGICRSKLNESYPIRKTPNSSKKLSQEDVNLIIELLKYSYRFNGEIARQFNVEVHVINAINKGLRYKQPGETYPIRNWKSCGAKSFTYEQVTEIIELLKNTNLSFRQIAKKYNVTHNQISAICYGTNKKYRRKDEHYPIRKPS